MTICYIIVLYEKILGGIMSKEQTLSQETGQVTFKRITTDY